MTDPRASEGLQHERNAHRLSRGRSGLTLIEMLISVTITLLIVFAIVQVFELLGDTMTQGRATIEMAGNLRNVANVLQRDLDNLTCPVRPWLDPAAGLGYFEYIEGWNDGFPRGSDVLPRQLDTSAFIGAGRADDNAAQIPASLSGSHFGDLDDVLMMTVRAAGEPFRGRWDPDNDNTTGFELIESAYAEVIWWTLFNPSKNTFELHRRVLLIRPDLSHPQADMINTAAALRTFYANNDISVRVDVNPVTNAVDGVENNSLADLTTPRNRFAHYPENFFPPLPSDAIRSYLYPMDLRYLNLTTPGQVVLSDMLAFDVRAFDPQAPIRLAGNVSLTPGDPGFGTAQPPDAIGQGTFVDLQFPFNLNLGGLPGVFKGINPVVPKLDQKPSLVHYDTWSLEFERDGIDQDYSDEDPGNNIVDQGFDGIDNPHYEPPGNPMGGIDDISERETSPPYNVPLMGIEVRIRIMEHATRQVRQVSVVGDFSDQ